MRIMTNYLQILAAAMSFNLHFPDYMTKAFSGASRVGNSTGVLLSFDCLLMKSSFAKHFDDIAYLKISCMAILPPLLILMFFLGFLMVFFRDRQRLFRYTCVSSITIFFLIHPTLTSYALRMFKCNNIGNGISRVEMDIDTDCWSPQHMKWVYSLGLPMLIIYVAGFPILVFVILFTNRNHLNDPQVLRYFLLLYQGVKHDRYYWELVNTFRKFILLFLHVFIVDEFKVIKAMCGAFILFVCSIMQARLKPYKINVISDLGKIYNFDYFLIIVHLEHREMLSSMLTLYGGLIFVQEDDSLQFLHIFIFILVVAANIRFWVLWIFCVL